jgi:hypothetical protein
VFDKAPPGRSLDMVRQLEGLPPGPELLAFIESLGPAGPGVRGLAESVVAGCERLISSLHATALQWMLVWEREVARAGIRGDQQRHAEMARSLGISDWEADMRMASAKAIAGSLPRVGAALAAGELSWPKARAVSLELAGLTPEQAAPAEARLLAMAEWAGPRQLRREARRMAAAIAGTATAGKPVSATGEQLDRFLVFGTPRSADMPVDYVAFEGVLPPEPGALLIAAIDRMAGPWRADDGRPIDVRRADALAELARRHADTDVPRGSGSRAALNLVMSVDTFLGGPQPAELNGWTVPGEAARRMACDPVSVTRLLADPMSGQLLDLGRTTREPTARLRRFICLRDQHCQFPDCTRPAEACDVHHAIYWAAGGTTDPVNCFLLCPKHHMYVHELGWSARRDDGGRTTWTDPGGGVHHTHAPPVLPPPVPPPDPAPD